MGDPMCNQCKYVARFSFTTFTNLLFLEGDCVGDLFTAGWREPIKLVSRVLGYFKEINTLTLQLAYFKHVVNVLFQQVDTM
jgi:hypothetical protein